MCHEDIFVHHLVLPPERYHRLFVEGCARKRGIAGYEMVSHAHPHCCPMSSMHLSVAFGLLCLPVATISSSIRVYNRAPQGPTCLTPSSIYTDGIFDLYDDRGELTSRDSDLLAEMDYRYNGSISALSEDTCTRGNIFNVSEGLARNCPGETVNNASDVHKAASISDDASKVSAVATSFGSARKLRLPDQETYIKIQTAYLEMRREISNTSPHLHHHYADFLRRLEEPLRSQQYYSAFTVPVEVRETNGTPAKGRGLFAVKSIAKGTVMRRSAHAMFYHQTEWDCFLAKLPVPLQSDVHVWAYVMEWDESDPFVLALDLDEGSLINHAPTMEKDPSPFGSVTATSSSANVYFAEDRDGVWWECASRDIQSGEEILCDYTTFVSLDHSLDWYTYQHPV